MNIPTCFICDAKPDVDDVDDIIADNDKEIYTCGSLCEGILKNRIFKVVKYFSKEEIVKLIY